MGNHISILQWQQNFLKGDYDASTTKTQIEAGWYDWFCKDLSLRNKTYKMGAIIKQLKTNKRFDITKCFITFKNNCPVNGPLYDRFSICEMDIGSVIYSVEFNCIFNPGKYTVYGKDNDFQEPLLSTNSTRVLIKWLNGEEGVYE